VQLPQTASIQARGARAGIRAVCSWREFFLRMTV